MGCLSALAPHANSETPEGVFNCLHLKGHLRSSAQAKHFS